MLHDFWRWTMPMPKFENTRSRSQSARPSIPAKSTDVLSLARIARPVELAKPRPVEDLATTPTMRMVCSGDHVVKLKRPMTTHHPRRRYHAAVSGLGLEQSTPCQSHCASRRRARCRRAVAPAAWLQARTLPVSWQTTPQAEIRLARIMEKGSAFEPTLVPRTVRCICTPVLPDPSPAKILLV